MQVISEQSLSQSPGEIHYSAVNNVLVGGLDVYTLAYEDQLAILRSNLHSCENSMHAYNSNTHEESVIKKQRHNAILKAFKDAYVDDSLNNSSSFGDQSLRFRVYFERASGVTPDIIVTIDGKLFIGDVKTESGPYNPLSFNRLMASMYLKLQDFIEREAEVKGMFIFVAYTDLVASNVAWDIDDIFLEKCGSIMTLVQNQLDLLSEQGLLIREMLTFNENSRAELNRSLDDFSWEEVSKIFTQRCQNEISRSMFIDKDFDRLCENDLVGVSAKQISNLHKRNAKRLLKCGKETMLKLILEKPGKMRDDFIKRINDFGEKQKKSRFIQWNMMWVKTRPVSMHFEELTSIYADMPTGTGVMGQLWNALKDGVYDNYENFVTIDPEIRLKAAINATMELDDLSKKSEEELAKMRGYTRSIEEKVRYKLTVYIAPNFLQKMVESGRADKYKKAFDRETRKSLVEDPAKALAYEKRKCFNFYIDTSDISKFISSNEWFEQGQAIDCSNYTRVTELLPWSDIAAEVTVTTLFSTKLFSWLSFISAIAWQASLNLNKESNSNNQWQLNYIEQFGAFVAMNSKGMHQNVMLSYAVKKSDFGFSEPHCNLDTDSMKWAMSDLITLNPNAIESLVNCDAKIMANLIGLCDMINIRPEDVVDISLNNERVLWVRRYIMSQVCILLSNKAEVISGVAQFRYGFMEAVKAPILPLLIPINPYRICKKFTYPRTRLLVHFYKEYLKAMEVMLKISRQVDDDSELLDDSVRNLRCPMAPGVPIESLRQGLMGVYIGWILEKPQIVSTFKSFKDLATKICEEELAFKKAFAERRGYCNGEGVPNRDLLTLHQFNREMISGSNAYNDSLMQKKFGENYRDLLWLEFSDRIISTTPEDLASVKASCELDTQPGLSEEARRAVAGVKSEKVAIKIMQLLLKGTVGHNIVGDVINVARKMIEETSWIDDDGIPGIVAKLFSKPEITRKTREILILHILSRLIQYISETWSRTVCARISCEMLSKPLSKETKMRKHAFKIAKAAKKATARAKEDVIPITIYDSGDMSRWCQGLNMRAFYQTDAFLLPVFARPFWALINNLFMNKKIRLPVELAKGFKDKPNFKDMNPAIETLANEFHGRVEAGLLTKDKHWIKLISGMLQGIRQWKSSQDHAWHQNYFVFLVVTNFKNQMKTAGIEVLDYVTTSLISSDDFAFAFTVFIKKSRAYQINRSSLNVLDDLNNRTTKGLTNIQVVQNHLELASYSVGSARFEISAKPAEEKYTHCSFSMWEFNQMFWPRGGSNGQQSVLIPGIKFLSNCISMAAFDGSLAGRMQEWVGRAQALSKSGIAPSTVHCISHLQALAHYRFLGLGVDALFSNFAKMIREKPHPAFGYFVPPTIHLGGVETFEYLLYVLCMSNPKSRAVHRSIWKHPEFVTNLMNPMSIFTASLNLGGGRMSLIMSAKLKKLWSGFDTKGEDWDEFLEKRPMLALQRSQDINTSALKIVMNYHMVPVKSLRPISAMIPAAFVLTHPVMLIRTSMNPLSKDRKVVKHSLLKVIHDLVPENSSIFDEKETQMLFPAYEVYNQMMMQVAQFAKAVKTVDRVIPVGRQEVKRSAYATTRRSGTDIPVALEKLCYEIWSGKLDRESYRDEWLIMFRRYQTQMPFLKLTLKETIESIPNGSINNVMALLKTAVYRTATFYSLGAYSRGKMQIENMVSETLARYRAGVRYNVGESNADMNMSNRLRLALRRLFKVSSWFEKPDNKQLNMRIIPDLCAKFTTDELETFLTYAGKEKRFEKLICLFLLTKKRDQENTQVSSAFLGSYAPGRYLFFKTPTVKPADILSGKEFDYKSALARFTYTTRGNQVISGVVGTYEKKILFIMTKGAVKIGQLSQLLGFFNKDNKMVGWCAQSIAANNDFRNTYPGVEYVLPGTQKYNGNLGRGASFKDYCYVTLGAIPDEGNLLISPVYEINGRKLNMYSSDIYLNDAPLLQINLFSADPGQFDEQINDSLILNVTSVEYPKSFRNWVNDLESPELSVKHMIEHYVKMTATLESKEMKDERRFFFIWLMAIVDITVIDVDKSSFSALTVEDKKMLLEARAAVPAMSTGPKGEIDFGKTDNPDLEFFNNWEHVDFGESDDEDEKEEVEKYTDFPTGYLNVDLDEPLEYGLQEEIPVTAIAGPMRELTTSRKALVVMQREMRKIATYNRYMSLESNLTKTILHIKTKIGQGQKVQPTDLGAYYNTLSPFFKFVAEKINREDER